MHVMDFDGIECIFCGPNRLYKRDGAWKQKTNGDVAWSVSYN